MGAVAPTTRSWIRPYVRGVCDGLMRQLLDDLVVVEVSEEPAGAFCGKAFADLGAEVVKVEPPSGDRLRERPGAFAHLNTNKRSVVLEPGTSLDPLLRDADIVIESLGWGDLGGRGVDVSALRARQPAVVVATISGFGADGPYAGYRWTDLVGQAAAWSTLPQAYAEQGVPVKLPGIVALCLTGQTAALGALAAAAGHGDRCGRTGGLRDVGGARLHALAGNPLAG